MAVGHVEVEGFAGLTAGNTAYLSIAAAGGIQEAAPGTAGTWRQAVGTVLAADRVALYFPDPGYQVGASVHGGAIFTQVAGTGGVAVGDLVGWGSGGDAGKLIKGNAAAGANVPAVAIALVAAAAGATGVFARAGLVAVAGRTAGAAQYLAEAGGGASQEAAPAGGGKYKQIVGWALSATSLFVCFPEVGAQL
jgi:hypothetical protein